VHRIAINTAISYQRYSRMREVGQVIQRLGRPTLPPDPGSVAERSDLFNALRKLPPKQAAAIVLRHHHGYTNREIAAALQIPERTVASRLIAAKARLRQILDSEPRKGPGIDMSTLSEDGVPSE
jgi:RNA polymerase sigma factor (sigma-70 family)